MNEQLFNRSYILDLGAPKKTASMRYTNIDSGNGKNSALRIAFEIEKNTLGSSSNHSKIAIYNLSTESRQKIVKGWSLQLQAGYDGAVGTIFVGNVFNVKSERKGADIITVLECLDGGSAISYGTFDKSYGKGTPLYQILQDVAKAMSLTSDTNPSGVNAGVVIGLPDFKIGYSFTAIGACKDTLDKLLKPLGLGWSVQNGALTILPQTSHSGQAILMSSTSGMIGVPSFNNDLLSFKSLLNPKVIPNALIKMVSENVALNGFYKINLAKYEGDTHENKWNINCEAFKVGNISQAYPASSGYDFSKAVV